jgi:hypothetical protein
MCLSAGGALVPLKRSTANQSTKVRTFLYNTIKQFKLKYFDNIASKTLLSIDGWKESGLW